MIAALPMYDHAGLRAAHDALWCGIRDDLRQQGVDAPERLSRTTDHARQWSRADLLLGQICGLPYRAALHDRVTLVATLDYALPGGSPGYYYSLFVTRAQDSRTSPQEFGGAALAYNEADSHSGWGAAWLTGVPFRPALATGAHRLSARAVADGQAEIAAIDAITWRALCRFEPEVTRRLRVIGRTAESPGQALVTATPALAAPLRKALRAAMTTVQPPVLSDLGIAGVTEIPAAAYLAVPNPPPPHSIAAHPIREMATA